MPWMQSLPRKAHSAGSPKRQAVRKHASRRDGLSAHPLGCAHRHFAPLSGDWYGHCVAPALGRVSSFLLRLQGFQLLFIWPGWLVLRLLTLGRYPQFLGPRRNAPACEDVELVSCTGLVTSAAGPGVVDALWGRVAPLAAALPACRGLVGEGLRRGRSAWWGKGLHRPFLVLTACAAVPVQHAGCRPAWQSKSAPPSGRSRRRRRPTGEWQPRPLP